MIVQMSTESNVYHRPDCRYLLRIREEHLTALDMDDEKIAGRKPCKYCCNLKTIYQNYKPNLKNVFADLDIQSEFTEPYIKVHTNWYDWRIYLKASSQNIKLYREVWSDTYQSVSCEKCDGLKETKELASVMQYIAKEERVAFYPKPYRKYAMAIEEYAKQNQLQIEYDGTDLYILTDIAAWKIAYGYHYDWFKLLHCPFSERKLTMDEAKQAHYHVQADVPKGQSPAKHLKYIFKHDTAKKIEAIDYKKLPQKTKREKKYYRQAKERQKRKSVNRVLDIFAQLEEKDGIKSYSFC